jgi:hypothetical protein
MAARFDSRRYMRMAFSTSASSMSTFVRLMPTTIPLVVYA